MSGSLAVALVAAAIGFILPPAQAGTSLEYAVKATFLYKFAPFVEWPEIALPPPNGPLNICVAGRNPFNQLLDRAVAGQRLNGHPFAIRHMAQVTADSDCQILFVGGSDEQSVAQGLDQVRGRPVLTVTDSDDDSASHGVINFVVSDNKVRFQIDEVAAERNRIAISSKLLSLALPPRKSH